MTLDPQYPEHLLFSERGDQQAFTAMSEAYDSVFFTAVNLKVAAGAAISRHKTMHVSCDLS